MSIRLEEQLPNSFAEILKRTRLIINSVPPNPENEALIWKLERLEETIEVEEAFLKRIAETQELSCLK